MRYGLIRRPRLPCAPYSLPRSSNGPFLKQQRLSASINNLKRRSFLYQIPIHSIPNSSVLQVIKTEFPAEKVYHRLLKDFPKEKTALLELDCVIFAMAVLDYLAADVWKVGAAI